jgi:Tfp pilus assembly protein PilX
MKHMKVKSSRFATRARRQERGVALITALLLLMLLSGLALAMSWSAGSDKMINGYYGNFRGSFYAADSGLSIARQAIINQLEAAAPAAFSATTPPIPAGTEATVAQFITTTYGNGFTTINNGSASSSWPEKFKIVNVTLSLPAPPTTTTDAKGNITQYQYRYTYSLTAIGQARGTENAKLIDSGNIFLTANIAPTATKQSFAAWGMFIDQYALCGGGDLVPGTITGPVFTNGAWNFGTGGQYTFTDSVGSVNADAGYDFGGGNGGCQSVAGPSDTVGGTTIAPKFNAGFNLGQAHVPLPQNSFSQERAVLDGIGTNSVAPTNAELNAKLRDVSNTAYPTGGASTGVFLPYTTVGPPDATGKPTTIPPTFKGGGIYVQGDASVVLSPGAGSAQVYTITQGTTTTTITIDPVANTTTMVSGGTSLNIIGVPTMFDSGTGAAIGPDTMLYVNGNISSLSGPGQGQPALQNGNGLTITAASNITITGDVLYKTEPVTLAATSTTPIDTLVPAGDTKQVLGIYTANGDIQMNSNHPVCTSTGNCTNSLEIDASIAMLCDPSGGSCAGNGGLTNTGAALDTLTIVGGRIQNQIKNINTTTRNVLFDRRFASNGFAPPWFISTVITPGTDSATFGSSTQRTGWLDQTSTF